MENEQPTIQKETIKLIKNSKGYTWEIRTFLEGDEVTFVRLRNINNKMMEEYGKNETA
jgi:hypothetical protein